MRAIHLVVLAPVLALAAACGGSSATTTLSAGSDPGTATTDGACATSDLQVKLGSGEGAAGSQFVPLVFTNTGSGSCSLDGYPGVSFVDANGDQVGNAATRNAQHDPSRVTLQSGDSASAVVQIGGTTNFPPADCAAKDATALRVYPPDSTEATDVDLDAPMSVCSGDVDQLSVEAVVSGTSGM